MIGMKQYQAVRLFKGFQKNKLKGILIFLFYFISSFFLGMVLPSNGLSQEEKQEEGPSHFLRQTEIIGSIMNPMISYKIPWRKPESIEDSRFLGTRNIFQDLFVPIHPEVFERVFQIDKKIMKEGGGTIPQRSDQPLKGE